MNYYGINELPETYKRYKTYTNDFETWLMKAAKRRGLEIAAQAEADAKDAAVKQKEKKGRRHIKPYRILQKDILPIAQAVANSGMPLDDISGLTDLNDAIRARKEVGEWYRYNKKSDEQHPFFVSVLDDVRNVFKGWLFTSTMRVEVGNGRTARPDSIKTEGLAILIDLSNNIGDKGGNEDNEDVTMNKEARPGWSDEAKASSKRHVASPVVEQLPEMTQAELDMDEDFQVLCFLYDLFQLRQRVKHVWGDWVNRKVGTMTAALVSDLALGVVHKNVGILVENLDDDADSQKILRIIDKLCQLLSADDRRAELPSEDGDQVMYAPDLLCMEAIYYMKKFWRLEADGSDETLRDPSHESFILRFLLHFKLIKTNELRLATLDRFTESFCSPKARTEIWLPFGFQIMLDIQQNVTSHLREVYVDVFDHGVHTADLIRAHMMYEDEMWNKGDKPDYMTVGEIKFSNVYLPTLERLLDWLKQLTCKERGTASGMYIVTFLALHPILSGLTMWFYHRSYHSSAISKAQWFIVALAHLYNACRKVGGLAVPWADLEFIIQSQGAARIYVGGPPTDPSFFPDRLCLALCSSMRMFAKDYRGDHKRATHEGKRKRGLASYGKVEGDIRDYYDTKASSDRWMRLHNLFALLKTDLDKIPGKGPNKPSDTKTQEVPNLKDRVSIIFASIAAKRASSFKNKRSRKKSKVRLPDFSKLHSVHDQLLEHAACQLKDQELYAQFDHLSFFRRAYAALSRIRSELLWDHSQALTTINSEQEPPNDFQLLVDLFRDLTPPIDKKDTKRVAKNLEAMENLKKISAILHDVIQGEGDVETKKAEDQFHRRQVHGTMPSKRKLRKDITVQEPAKEKPPDNEGARAAEVEPRDVEMPEPEQFEMPQPDEAGVPEIKEAGFGTGKPGQVEFPEPDQPEVSDPDDPDILFIDKEELHQLGSAYQSNCEDDEEYEELIFTATELETAKSLRSEAQTTGQVQTLAFVQTEAQVFVEVEAQTTVKAEVIPSPPQGLNPFQFREITPIQDLLSVPVKAQESIVDGMADDEFEPRQFEELVPMQEQRPMIAQGMIATDGDRVFASFRHDSRRLVHDETCECIHDEVSTPVQEDVPTTPQPEVFMFEEAIMPTQNQVVHTECNGYGGKKGSRGRGARDRRTAARAAARAATDGQTGSPGDTDKNQEQENVSDIDGEPDENPVEDPAPSIAVPKKPKYLLGIYHRLTYRSTRTTRRNEFASRLLFYHFVGRVSSDRLVGAKKHHIFHQCYGRCFVGRAILGCAYKGSSHADTVPEDDDWEVDDEIREGD
ncbi:hypothetical protein N0V90_003110 [Kalmusia sp. IMI 367209]|nr:hypothetical protein N0V90_003110 [Kalmusia sp. IMI 367209]